MNLGIIDPPAEEITGSASTSKRSGEANYSTLRQRNLHGKRAARSSPSL